MPASRPMPCPMLNPMSYTCSWPGPRCDGCPANADINASAQPEAQPEGRTFTKTETYLGQALAPAAARARDAEAARRLARNARRRPPAPGSGPKVYDPRKLA